MICLATLLLQPELPDAVIIDEPELGLHPFAIHKLAAMLKSAASKSQIIISTQSVNLVDHFQADDVIVVERRDNQTVLSRQSEEAMAIGEKNTHWMNCGAKMCWEEHHEPGFEYTCGRRY